MGWFSEEKEEVVIVIHWDEVVEELQSVLDDLNDVLSRLPEGMSVDLFGVYPNDGWSMGDIYNAQGKAIRAKIAHTLSSE